MVAWRDFWQVMRSTLTTLAGPVQADLGASFASGVTVGSAFPAEAGLASYTRHPWVAACVRKIATDLSKLPLKVVGEEAGANGARVVALLARPQSRWPGVLWRRQLVVDLVLTGNVFLLLAGRAPGMLPLSLVRLDPRWVEIEPHPALGIASYRYGLGVALGYRPEDVVHIRETSVRDGAEALFGDSVVQALHADLATDFYSARLSAELARRGRPAAIISPKDANTVWTDKVREAIALKYSEEVAKGGAVVLGAGVDLQLPAWSPRDMEFAQARLAVRDAVLGVFGVPPVEVGLPTANYATAQEQRRQYWENLQGLAALFDEAFTQVARLVDREARVMHDFSGVEALQVGRTARLDNVTKWVLLGAEPRAAAEYEGFVAPPLMGLEPPAPAPKAAAESGRMDWFTRWGAPAIRVPEDRAALWRAFEARTRLPMQRALGQAAALALTDQARLLATRLEARVGARAVRALFDLDEAMAWLFGPGASDPLTARLGPALRQALRQGWDATDTLLPGDPQSLPDWAAAMGSKAQLAELITNLEPTTRRQVRLVLEQGLREGWSVSEIQAQLQGTAAFGPARALNIARSEATRAVSVGSQLALEAAANTGLRVKKQWLATADEATRESHQSLDGQVVEVGEPFKTTGGREAQGPGQFGRPDEDNSCRCGVIPAVEES